MSETWDGQISVRLRMASLCCAVISGWQQSFYSPCHLSCCDVIMLWLATNFYSPCHLSSCAVINGWQQSIYSPCPAYIY